MPSAPTDRERWLALALLLAALLLAYLVLVHPWWTVPMRAADARIEELRTRELRVRMQLEQAGAVEQALAQARREIAARPGFLPEDSLELATAGLIRRLETVVAEASPGNRSCAITTRSPMTPAGQDRFPPVVVRVRLRCGVPELAGVLHALEGGTPRLFVDNLEVLSQRFTVIQNADAEQSGGVDVGFDLYGYLRPATGLKAPAAGGGADAP